MKKHKNFENDEKKNENVANVNDNHTMCAQ